MTIKPPNEESGMTEEELALADQEFWRREYGRKMRVLCNNGGSLKRAIEESSRAAYRALAARRARIKET